VSATSTSFPFEPNNITVSGGAQIGHSLGAPLPSPSPHLSSKSTSSIRPPLKRFFLSVSAQIRDDASRLRRRGRQMHGIVFIPRGSARTRTSDGNTKGVSLTTCSTNTFVRTPSPPFLFFCESTCFTITDADAYEHVAVRSLRQYNPTLRLRTSFQSQLSSMYATTDDTNCTCTPPTITHSYQQNSALLLGKNKHACGIRDPLVPCLWCIAMYFTPTSPLR
jgi:hypothetical protein